MKTLRNAMILISCLFLLTSCGGGGSGGGAAGPTNIGGGYTLLVSGGTLNDGSVTNGLAVLASLRDVHGVGPGLIGNWTITISGPGLAQPLRVDYDDNSSGSYSTWWWEGVEPSGTYTATATNGTTTLTYIFTIASTSTLPKPLVSVSPSTVSWAAVPGAGSYYYSVSTGSGTILKFGYIPVTDSTYSFDLPSPLVDGSYLIQVIAHTQDRLALGNNNSSAPTLAAQENLSLASKDFVMSGGNNTGSYVMTAKGGVLYMGKNGTTDMFGLAIWSSILTDSSSQPAGDWTVTVTNPNISPITFTYPKTSSHYLYWEFDTPPASGTYTVTAATAGSSDQLTTTFTIPDLAAKLDVATNIQVIPGPTGYMIAWNAVTGAKSYYVNLWADIGGNYTEVANAWTTETSSFIPKGSLTKGMIYDVYITASSEDMTTSTEVPPPSPLQINMSDNTFAAKGFTAN